MLLPRSATLEAVDPTAPATQAQLRARAAQRCPVELYWNQLQRHLGVNIVPDYMREDQDYGAETTD